MALPTNVSTVTVTGTFVYTDGTPAAGTVKFTPTNNTWLSDATAPAVLLPATVTATLDASGHFSTVLPATNDPDLAPAAYTYDVVETFGTLTRSYSIALPASPATVDLAAIAPISPLPGSGANVVTKVNGHTPDNTGAVVLTSADLGALRADSMGVLAAGAETIPRWAATDGTDLDMQSGVVRISYFVASEALTINQLSVSTGDISAGATPTLIRYGLYTVDAFGNLTQVGQTGSDTTVLASARTPYPLTLTTPVTLTVGQRYAIAALVVTPATAPTVMGVRAATAGDAARNPRMAANYLSAADLASSYTSASLSDTPSVMYAVALP